jgi:type IV secretory pathway VirB9-like protein
VQTTPPAPAQVIQSAHKSAQVQPTARGYFGGSAIHRYPWQLGKLYTVYVAPGKTTMLQLPPGEKLASALHLSAEDWEVSMVLVGNEVRQQNVIFVTPLVPHGDADIALVCETGRSFNVHLVVGKVGMFGVTWEIPPVGEIYVDESPIAGRP